MCQREAVCIWECTCVALTFMCVHVHMPVVVSPVCASLSTCVSLEQFRSSPAIPGSRMCFPFILLLLISILIRKLPQDKVHHAQGVMTNKHRFVHAHMHTSCQAHAHLDAHAHMHMHKHTHMHMHMNMHMHMHTCTGTHTCTCTCTCTCPGTKACSNQGMKKCMYRTMKMLDTMKRKK